MASPADNSGGEDIEHGGGVAVEMTATAATESLSPSSSPMEDAISISDEHITPLLNQSQRPRVNIFSVSHSRRRPVKVNFAENLAKFQHFVCSFQVFMENFFFWLQTFVYLCNLR